MRFAARGLLCLAALFAVAALHAPVQGVCAASARAHVHTLTPTRDPPRRLRRLHGVLHRSKSAAHIAAAADADAANDAAADPPTHAQKVHRGLPSESGSTSQSASGSDSTSESEDSSGQHHITIGTHATIYFHGSLAPALAVLKAFAEVVAPAAGASATGGTAGTPAGQYVLMVTRKQQSGVSAQTFAVQLQPPSAEHHPAALNVNDQVERIIRAWDRKAALSCPSVPLPLPLPLALPVPVLDRAERWTATFHDFSTASGVHALLFTVASCGPDATLEVYLLSTLPGARTGARNAHGGPMEAKIAVRLEAKAHGEVHVESIYGAFFPNAPPHTDHIQALKDRDGRGGAAAQPAWTMPWVTAYLEHIFTAARAHGFTLATLDDAARDIRDTTSSLSLWSMWKQQMPFYMSQMGFMPNAWPADPQALAAFLAAPPHSHVVGSLSRAQCLTHLKAIGGTALKHVQARLQLRRSSGRDAKGQPNSPESAPLLTLAWEFVTAALADPQLNPAQLNPSHAPLSVAGLISACAGANAKPNAETLLRTKRGWSETIYVQRVAAFREVVLLQWHLTVTDHSGSGQPSHVHPDEQAVTWLQAVLSEAGQRRLIVHSKDHVKAAFNQVLLRTQQPKAHVPTEQPTNK